MDLANLLSVVKGVFNTTLFELNKTPVTAASIFMFLIVMIIFFIASRLLNRVVLSRILSGLQIDRGTSFTLKRINHYIIMIVGALVAFQFVGIDLSGLAVIFGLLSVGIGFGLQNVTSNFVSGLILLFERPIKIGDRVTVGDTQGDVVAINMRATTIRSLNNISIIVPNSDFISSQVVNWSHGDTKVRLVVKVGVSYNSNLDKVLNSLELVAKENRNLLNHPAPEVLFMEFGDSSWNLELRVWLKDPKNYYQIQSEINCEIVRKFRQNNIEIPFPQRDVHFRSPLPIPLQTKSDDDQKD